jgi:hypothetical protein
MARHLLAIAMFACASGHAQGWQHPNDRDGDGWFDYPVDEATYPPYRGQPYYYGPPVYSPDPRSFRSAEERCEYEYQLYRESIDCFNRFRNQNGSVRGEAFSYCQEVRDPSPRCGPPRNW